VFRAWWRETKVAVKQLNNFSISEKDIDDFRSEAEILKNLRPHPNVVLFLGVTTPPQPLTIVAEFCEGGSLYALIQCDAKISEELEFKVLSQMAKGMLHLHSEGIVHRDLAARNILLTEHFDAKVTDFGMSRVKGGNTQDSKTTNDVGPLKWMPPESIKDKLYSYKTDVWSYGVVMYELLERQDPYGDLDAVTVGMRVVYEGLRLQCPQRAAATWKELMTKCFKENSEERPTFKEIANSFSFREKVELEKRGQNSSNIPGSVFASNESSYAPVQTDVENSYAPVVGGAPEEYGDMPSADLDLSGRTLLGKPTVDPGDNYANIFPLRTD